MCALQLSRLLCQLPLSLCSSRSSAAEFSDLPAIPCSSFYSCSKNKRCWIVPLFCLLSYLLYQMSGLIPAFLPLLLKNPSREILFWLCSAFLKQAACKLTPSTFPKTWKLLTRYCSARHLIHTCYWRTKYSLESPSHWFVFLQNFLKKMRL